MKLPKLKSDELWNLIKPFSYWSFDKKVYYAKWLSWSWINNGGARGVFEKRNTNLFHWTTDSIITAMFIVNDGNDNIIQLEKDRKLIEKIAWHLNKVLLKNKNVGFLDSLFSSLLTQQIETYGHDEITKNLFRYNFIFSHNLINEKMRNDFGRNPINILSYGSIFGMYFF